MGTFVMQNFQPNVGWLSAAFAGLLLAGIAHPAVAAEKNEKAKTPDVQIRTDPGIELMSIIFHLAGNPEYNRIRMESYAKEIDEHFGKYRDHEAVKLARQLRRTHGVSYDAPMSLAVHLTGGAKLQEKVPLDPLPADLDHRWTLDDTKKFLAAARQFAEDSKFADFYKAHEAQHSQMESRLKTLIGKRRPFGVVYRVFRRTAANGFYSSSEHSQRPEQLRPERSRRRRQAGNLLHFGRLENG